MKVNKNFVFSGKSQKKYRQLWAVILVVLMLAESLFSFIYYKSLLKDTGFKKEGLYWSTLEGAPTGNMKLSSDNPVITQYFLNMYEELDEFVVFFSHCAEADSGQVYVRIKDSDEKIYYEYCFEPKYIEEDVFCLIGYPEEVLPPNSSCSIEISAEGMGENDFIEAGTTLTPSKPAIFTPIDGANTLFTKLQYTYIDTESVWRLTGRLAAAFLLLDGIWILFSLFFILKKKKMTISILAVVIVSLGILTITKYMIEKNKWYNKYTYIAHAMGGIDGKAYTNSIEAFENAYREGKRVFEVDFCVTSDGYLVLKHDWENNHGLPEFENGYVPSREEFLEAKIWNKYTTIDLDMLLDIMMEYPDIYVITDSKSGNYNDVKEQFNKMNSSINKYSDSQAKRLAEHFVVQIYNDDMYNAVESVRHFDNYIYTLYQRGYNDLDKLAEFCVANDIEVVVMPYNWWTEDMNTLLHSYDLKVYIHTLNEESEIMFYLKEGAVDGIYTDFYSDLQ